MKANEAPEKIWVHELSAKELNVPLKEYHIEYTRTDTFIEKAISFIRDNIESDKYRTPDEESYKMGCNFDYFETNMFIEDFKNYLKGE